MVRMSVVSDGEGNVTLYLSDKGIKEGAKEALESAKLSEIFPNIADIIKEVYDVEGETDKIAIKVIPHEEYDEKFGAEEEGSESSSIN
ncbi:MAG: hypothetical protein QXL94_04375 [Candidatus Parvarchaeum sp.]